MRYEKIRREMEEQSLHDNMVRKAARVIWFSTAIGVIMICCVVAARYSI